MIRLANKFDRKEIFSMVNALNHECAIPQFQGLDADAHGDDLWHNLLAGQGVILVAVKKEKVVGCIIGIITQSVWSKSIRGLFEIAWYVKPEYRNTSISYRLMARYIKEGQDLKRFGFVHFLTISKMVNQFDRQFAKFGFKKTDENWIQ